MRALDAGQTPWREMCDVSPKMSHSAWPTQSDLMALPLGQNMLSLSGLSAYTAKFCFPLALELEKKVLLWVHLYMEKS